MVLIILLFIIGIYVGLVLPYHITNFVMWREKKKELNILTPVNIDYSKLCARHEWIEAVSVNEKYEYVPLNVCSKCGFIPSKDLMATKEGLKRVLENKEIREFEETILKDFSDKEHADITEFLKKELENGLTYEKINEIYHAGQTCNKRFIIYKMARSEEIKREPKDK